MIENNSVFIIAEAGSNWRMGNVKRDMKMAKTLIDVASNSNADAVKFQTYRAESVYVPDAGNSDYLSKSGINESINKIFDDLSMPYEMIPELSEYCNSKNIEFMSTPFSVEDAKQIDPYVNFHKIASFLAINCSVTLNAPFPSTIFFPIFDIFSLISYSFNFEKIKSNLSKLCK